MDATDEKDESYEFAKVMGEQLEAARITALLAQSGATDDGEGASSSELFRLGYSTGCYDTFDHMAKRVRELASVVRAMHHMLEEMVPRHDDAIVLRDMNALHSVIMGYLVQESEAILRQNRIQLVKASLVPDEYIDTTIPMSEIPVSELQRIGAQLSLANTRLFAIFAMSNGYLGPNDEMMTFEELREKITSGEIPAEAPPDSKLPGLYMAYGMRQIRQVRKMYGNLVESTNVFRKKHEKSASVVANDFIERLKAKQ